MGRGITALIVSLVLLALLAACRTASVQEPTATPFSGGPRLDFDRRSIDFGDVPFEKLQTATFTVKNVGDAPLTLRKVDLKLVQGC
jgi:hypothetical protein